MTIEGGDGERALLAGQIVGFFDREGHLARKGRVFGGEAENFNAKVEIIGFGELHDLRERGGGFGRVGSKVAI